MKKKEYNRLRERKRNASLNFEDAKVAKEKSRLRKQVKRADPRSRKLENEARKSKKTDPDARKTEKIRKQIRRADTQFRKEEKEKSRKHAKKNEKAFRERESFILIAANRDQKDFNESDFYDDSISSSIGSMFAEVNQCEFCEAYRFKGERNFCCGKGKVKIENLKDPPKKIQSLFLKESFLKDARGYNNLLSMASVGCMTPAQVQGPNFKIQGKLHHCIGSLIPADKNNPKFLQLYFYDSNEATDRRLELMPELCPKILKQLTDVLEKTNSYIKSFKAAYEIANQDDKLKIVLIGDKAKIPAGPHPRRYNLPQGSEIAALMPGEGDGELEVVIRDTENKLKRISTLHRSYDPLSYVLFDAYGTDGYHTGVGKKEGTNKKYFNR